MMLAEIWVGFSVKGRRFFYPSFAERVQVREQNKITNVTWSTVDSFSTPETHAMWGLFLVVVAAVILLSRQLLTRIPSRFEKKTNFLVSLTHRYGEEQQQEQHQKRFSLL